MDRPQPWSPADATRAINQLGRSGALCLVLTDHAPVRMEERDLLTGDVLFVLANGFVYEEPTQSTRPGFYKYRIQAASPNSGTRDVALVVIADPKSNQIKIVTVMWNDEPRT